MNAARLLICAVFIAIMTWLWYPYFVKPSDQQGPQESLIATPDYTAKGLTQSSYNDQGLLRLKVYAEQMELFDELGYTHFSKPVFTLYNQGERWRLNADEATLYNNNRLILENNVVATSLITDPLIKQVKAQVIHIDINEQSMESDEAVELLGPSLKVTGQGLVADMNTEVIELINHTQTVYYDQ